MFGPLLGRNPLWFGSRKRPLDRRILLGWSLTGGLAVGDPNSLYGFFFARLTSWNTGNQSLYRANRRNAKPSSISLCRQTMNNEVPGMKCVTRGQ